MHCQVSPLHDAKACPHKTQQSAPKLQLFTIIATSHLMSSPFILMAPKIRGHFSPEPHTFAAFVSRP